MRRRGPWRGVVAGFVVLAVVMAGDQRAEGQGEEPESRLEQPADPAEKAAESAGSWEAGESAPAPEAGAEEATSGGADDYVLGTADLILVRVWRNPELSVEVPVRPDGRISVPLLGDLQAAGLTTLELRDEIAAGLSEYIAAPDVTVIVQQVNSKLVFLVGEVVRPTALPLNREMRVLDAISLAGGFSPFANRRKVRILRPLPDGTVEQHKFNYNRFVKGKDPESNLQLRSGDTIVVPD